MHDPIAAGRSAAARAVVVEVLATAVVAVVFLVLDYRHAHFANTAGAVMAKIDATGDWNDELEAAFKKGIEEFKATGSW